MKALALLGLTLLALAAAHSDARASGDVVKIGVLTDMSGQFADESGMGSVTAVKMAVEDFGGKVLGKPIEVLVADHQNRPDIGSGKAREWFDVDKVDMIINLINSGVALPVTFVAREKNKIAIVNGSGSSKLTGDSCTPNSIHYAYDTYALAVGTARALIKDGYNSWYFMTADYAFGHALETDTSAIVKTAGGKVLGSTAYPMNAADLSAFLLEAQASNAKVIAIAGSGNVFINAVKSAKEFKVDEGGRQKIVGLLVWISDVHAMGLETAQGLILTTAFYWDRDEETRAFANRFFKRMGRMPNMGDAGDYSATRHYLLAIEKAGTLDTQAVMAKMRELPVNDFFAKNGRIREDGRFIHDMYVYEVKTPSESKKPWDYYKLRAVIPAEEAFRPLSQSTCSLVKK